MTSTSAEAHRSRVRLLRSNRGNLDWFLRIRTDADYQMRMLTPTPATTRTASSKFVNNA
jgi:hypothetical protein